MMNPRLNDLRGLTVSNRLRVDVIPSSSSLIESQTISNELRVLPRPVVMRVVWVDSGKTAVDSKFLFIPLDGVSCL